MVRPGSCPGGLFLRNQDPAEPLWGVSQNNVYAGNAAGGLYLIDAGFWSTNDTIAGNGATGIYMTGTVTSTAHLSNTILWNHSQSFATTPISPYNGRFDLKATYSDVEGGWPGVANLNTDPQFVGAGDYRLQATSPMIEAAETAAAPPIDHDAVPRPVDGDRDGTPEADIGAYEWVLAGVELGPDQSATTLPGTTVTYTLTITNAGGVADTYALDVSSNLLAWSVNIMPAMITLDPGESAVILVGVTPPAGASGTNAVVIRATSQYDSAVVAGATLETTAGAHVYLPILFKR